MERGRLRLALVRMVALACVCLMGSTAIAGVPGIDQYLQVCPDGRSFCYDGEPIFLRGYSHYTAAWHAFDYDRWTDDLERHNISLAREGGYVYTRLFNLPVVKNEQPFFFFYHKAWMNSQFFINLEAFVAEAAEDGTFVIIDLVDWPSMKGGDDPDGRWANNPLKWKPNGAGILPYPWDMFTSFEYMRMLRLTVEEILSWGHKNIIFQVVNEPLLDYYPNVTWPIWHGFHWAVINMIRGFDYEGLVLVNPQHNNQASLNANDLGADGITVHRAGILSEWECTCEAARDRLQDIEDLQQVPVISDTDGLVWPNCHRDSPQVLRKMVNAAKQSVAGIMHKDMEPYNNNFEDVDWEAMRILSGLVYQFIISGRLPAML